MESESVLTFRSYADLVYPAIFGVLLIAMVVEAMAPRRGNSTSLGFRWLNNFSLSFITWYAVSVLGAIAVGWVAQWSQFRSVGLFNTYQIGWLGQLLILMACVEFLAYWVHRVMHNVSWLWPLHAVHHADPDVDVSTTFRHHPIEPLLSLPLSIPLVLILGVSPEVAVAYRVFEVAAQVFSHTNVRVPEKVERYLRYILLTPDYHRTHHNANPRFTNTNYGSTLPWFDYLFGTAVHQPYSDQTKMKLGLEYLRKKRDQRLDRLLLAPFQLWRHPEVVTDATRRSARKA